MRDEHSHEPKEWHHWIESADDCRQLKSDFTTRTNSAEEVLGEIGLILVIILGIVLSINMVLVAMHVG
ncbi:MAG TPA: hypothetical protein VGI20_07000 [Rhizomicrobium sp.]|jgi:hypothetical protein